VQNSDLLLTLPTTLATQLIAQQQEEVLIVQHNVPFDLNTLETHLYWHQNTEQDEALSWFRQQIHALWND
jgi:DNA-binding transcriptional LysR family regulator